MNFHISKGQQEKNVKRHTSQVTCVRRSCWPPGPHQWIGKNVLYIKTNSATSKPLFLLSTRNKVVSVNVDHIIMYRIIWYKVSPKRYAWVHRDNFWNISSKYNDYWTISIIRISNNKSAAICNISKSSFANPEYCNNQTYNLEKYT